MAAESLVGFIQVLAQSQEKGGSRVTFPLGGLYGKEEDTSYMVLSLVFSVVCLGSPTNSVTSGEKSIPGAPVEGLYRKHFTRAQAKILNHGGRWPQSQENFGLVPWSLSFVRGCPQAWREIPCLKLDRGFLTAKVADEPISPGAIGIEGLCR